MDEKTKIEIRKALVHIKELMEDEEFLAIVRERGYKFDPETILRLQKETE